MDDKKAILFLNAEEEIECSVNPGCYAPEKAHPEDAGFDIRTPKDFWIFPWTHRTIDTGIHVMIPDGYEGKLESKSGLNVKYNIWSTGIIDRGYTGTIRVKLYALGFTFKHFKTGDKITQLVVTKIHPSSEMKMVEKVRRLGERGNNGFGSTGR